MTVISKTRLRAKPVVANQYWILQRDDSKIGEIEITTDGCAVKLPGRVALFKNLKTAGKAVNIEFEAPSHVSKPDRDRVHGYDTGCTAYNGVWNVKLRIPLFTKTAKSKSWFAAGWYAVKHNRSWKIVRNPKLILLERYAFRGPFQSRESVEQQLAQHA
jgi:hypothetical protein